MNTDYYEIVGCSILILSPFAILIKMCMQPTVQEQLYIEQLDAEENLLDSSFQVNIEEEQPKD